MPSQTISQAAIHGALGERLQHLLNELVRKKRIPHAVLGVARGDGSGWWTGAAGDGTPMTPDRPYFIASVTKLYIATVILQLYEGGDLGLDGRMVDYLGDAVEGIHRIDGTDYTPAITIRKK